MPREETRHPFSDEEKGKVLDPNPERRRYLTEVFYKFLAHKISVADLVNLPKKKFGRLAEIGYVKYKYGRYQEAQQIFKTLSVLDSVNAYYHTALGGVYQKMHKYVDSVVSYTRALRINGKELCCYVNRGEIYLRHKNYKKAADDFRNAILLDPSGRNMWANRARSLVIALKRNMEIKKRVAQMHAQQAGQGARPGASAQGARPVTSASARPASQGSRPTAPKPQAPVRGTRR
ncbi:MAG TPA: tetratricopeptide repeat protein [bacterium]|nr:tetratricopeptide repeat protein [bacterium]